MKSKRQKLNYRVLQDLKRRSSIGIIFYIILVPIVIYAGDCHLKYKTFAFFFVFSVCTICFLRFLHVLLFDRINNLNERFNTILFFVLVGLTSLIWGIGFAWFMFMPVEPNSKLLMAMCTVGLSSGGIVAFMPNRSLSFVYNFFMVVPAAILLIVSDVNLPLATMILLFFGYMIGITFRGNREYWDAMNIEVILQEKSEALEKAIRIDDLTGLYNRRFFNEVFETEWKKASRDKSLFTIVMGDIDHFKLINDTYGHLAGDECLRQISLILRSIFKRDTDVVARYGGEEFVVIMPDTDSMRAFEMAEQVRQKVESTRIEYKGDLLKLTISFGIASVVPDYKESKHNLVNDADSALYRAKLEGRNRVKVR
ncbi:diguanylate cyclase [bacterium]|nr:diguanylate cyclase [bacterium]